MRNNMPVTNNEYDLSDTETIVSTTDLQGNITYANPYFIAVSGFTEDELIGQPQNILRHPDMPVEAFADLWASIKKGQAWTGMVKNRCKNGDFYWVVANVTPVIEGGSPVGYMSVRTKPSRTQISEAQALYQEMRNGNKNGIALQQGQVVGTGVFAKLARLTDVSLTQRIALCMTLLISALVLLSIAVMMPQTLAPGSSVRLGLTVLGAVAIASALYFWYSLSSGLIAPLKQALRSTQIMAGGDMTQEITTDRNDDVGQLLRSLRQLRVNLHSIVRDVRNNFEEIGVATREIATGNMDLSSRTESQASALEETASSMEELSSTVQQNSVNAGQSNTMASEALKVAGKGGEIVERVVNTMGDIGQSSKKIVDIISIIEGIAFQTNILALNAAVEAARAGEQGRGFAVVASEVRNLAQRSAAAAKEIKGLIDVSVQNIDHGVALAEQAGVTMKEIISSVHNVSSIMSEIDAASREQSAGISQVNNAVMQMDEVTQQNAALVEEAAAAAASLEEQTQRVVKALTVFKLDSGRAASTKQSSTRRSSPPPPQSKPRVAQKRLAPARTSAQFQRLSQN